MGSSRTAPIHRHLNLAWQIPDDYFELYSSIWVTITGETKHLAQDMPLYLCSVSTDFLTIKYRDTVMSMLSKLLIVRSMLKANLIQYVSNSEFKSFSLFLIRYDSFWEIDLIFLEPPFFPLQGWCGSQSERTPNHKQVLGVCKNTHKLYVAGQGKIHAPALFPLVCLWSRLPIVFFLLYTTQSLFSTIKALSVTKNTADVRCVPLDLFKLHAHIWYGTYRTWQMCKE